MISARLLDARSTSQDWDEALAELASAKLVGIDCETQDEDRHPGLNQYKTKSRLVFDHRRATMTGFSWHVAGSSYAWYLNLAHADIENRIPWHVAKQILDAIPADAVKVAHNAPFELVHFYQCHGVWLDNLVCTLQLAVTHHGPDEYDPQRFYGAQLNGFRKLVPDVLRLFENADRNSLSSSQQELLNKFTAKESDAAHSYNGFVKDIAIGYSLKKLTKSHFGVDQMTFEQVLASAGAKHMGELTGEQVVAYGADDAYWAVKHYEWMTDDLLKTNPQALVTFFKTENPMVTVYAECWRDGLRMNMPEVFKKQAEERAALAKTLRQFKDLIRQCLPFPQEPNEKLAEKQDWYAKNWASKRKQIEVWATSPDSDDDFTQLTQTSNPIGNSWAESLGHKLPKAGRLNLIYYQTMRVILHDLLGHRLIYSDGEITTDKEARGKIAETYEREGNQTKLSVMRCIQNMADIEQRMKLFIEPFIQLMDPETGRVYPTLSSQLATRRLAGRNPNAMQLSKGGESAYIRGFFLPDDDESLIVSADWSAIELVLIAELSGDPEFQKVFGQIPYGDLHTGVAADLLSVKTLPGLTEEEFREFKYDRNPNNRDLRHIFTNEPISPKEYFKLTRGTPVGKGANFGYFYSGALSTVGSNLGWTSDQMWTAVEKYRERFAVAEAWRVGVCDEVVSQGFVTLPDGHRRVRLEATGIWSQAMKRKFMDLAPAPAMETFAEIACRKTATRAKNQAVNAMIQGTCATLAKRSILRIRELTKEAGIDHLVRMMTPIHDELVYSAHKSVAQQFIEIQRRAMCEHPDIVKSIPLHCTVAIGRTFQPFNRTDPKLSQIELDEAFSIPGIIEPEWEGKPLSDEKVSEVIEWLMAA